MIKHSPALLLVMMLAQTALHAAERPVLLTGEVQPRGAVPIVMPPSNTSPAMIRYFKEEGARVAVGETVLRIDPTGLASLSQLEGQLGQARALGEREVADLKVAELTAQTALVDAQTAAAKAQLDAAVPKAHLSPLDFDRYASEAARTAQDVEQKRRALDAAVAAVARRQRDAELALQKAQVELAFVSAERARTEVKAQVAGVVTHGFNEWRGRRYDEGESAGTGAVVGQILNGQASFVRAYALEVDRTALRVGLPVVVWIDALPALRVESTIEAIASAPEPRASWGEGRYFQVSIGLPDPVQPQLVPGMSVRVEPASSASPSAAVNVSAAPLVLEGEIFAARKSQIAPPSIKDTWQLTLQMLAPEGSIIGPERPVAVFDGQTLMQQRSEKQGKLAESQKAIDKLNLEHAQAQRDQALAVAYAHSEAEKAARKASQPASLVGGIAYKKLLLDKTATQQRVALAEALEQAQREARRAALAEQQLIAQQLSTDLADLDAAVAKLQVKPTLSGMVIHNAGFNGEKFTTGSQVFVGFSVASVADMSSLQVNAWVPEALAEQVRIGQRAEVVVGNGARTLGGKVSALGSLFRSKSRSQPVIVRDVTVTLDEQPGAAADATLKPGAAVRVRLVGKP